MRTRLLLLTVTAGLVAAAFAGLSLAGRSDEGKRVDVSLKEYRFIGAPAKLAPGETEFYFANKGKFQHNFTVVYTSQGASKFRSQTLNAGKTQELKVDLKPGSYLVVCTVFNGYHASLGMVKRFTVGKIDFKTGKWGP